MWLTQDTTIIIQPSCTLSSVATVTDTSQALCAISIANYDCFAPALCAP